MEGALHPKSAPQSIPNDGLVSKLNIKYPPYKNTYTHNNKPPSFLSLSVYFTFYEHPQVTNLTHTM